MENQYKELTTSRLLLRKLRESDWKTVSYLRSDPIINKYIDRPLDDSKFGALAFIDKIKNGIIDGKLFSWVITMKDDDSMIGSICLWNLSEDRKTAEVGYDLKPDFHGQGIMNESLQAIMIFAIEKLKFENVEAFTHRDNLSSVKLLQRNGFKLMEGRRDEDNTNNIVFNFEVE